MRRCTVGDLLIFGIVVVDVVVFAGLVVAYMILKLG